MIRAGIHHLASDLVGAGLACLYLGGYALLVTAIVFGIVRLFEWVTPDASRAASETPEDGR